MRTAWVVVGFWLLAPATPSAPPHASPTARAAAQESDRYERLAERWRAKLRDRPEFQVLVERPFVVIGDDSPEAIEQYARGTVRWAVRHLRALYFARDPAEVITIWLFKDKESYEQHCKELFQQDPHTPFGFYSPQHQSLIMNIQTGGGTLVHEIVHPFMAANFPDCPAWFNEGLASLYEQSREQRGRIWGLTNWRLPALQQAIREQRTLPLERMCTTTRDEFYSERSLFYAQARYLCYYLQEHGRLTAFYRSFRDHVREDPTGWKTLQKTLDAEDMAAFEQEWQQFVLRLN